jgi:hypothetical protein
MALDNILFLLYSRGSAPLRIEEISYNISMWTFLDFVSARGSNEIHDWLNSRDVRKEAKAKINARLVALQGIAVFPEQFFSSYVSSGNSDPLDSGNSGTPKNLQKG